MNDSNSKRTTNERGKEDALTLKLLQAIEERNDVSQRHLSRKLGVALGLTNSYLKRCIRKGLVKFREVPSNRYLYYLTPKGFAEKSRLTAEYLSVSFSFYGKASQSCANIYQICVDNDWRRVTLCGISEFAEIAYLRAQEYHVTIDGIYDERALAQYFFGLPHFSSVSQFVKSDVYIVTSLSDPEKIYRAITSAVAPKKVLVPDILDFGLKDAVSLERL